METKTNCDTIMETKQMCPLKFTKDTGTGQCETDCAWFCHDTGECAVMKISTELIKLMGE